MRIVLQRVTEASVTVNGETVGQIGEGFLLLAGVTHDDTEAEADWLAEKVAGLRVFEDADGRLNLSLRELDVPAVLVVSQFTLYADARRGRRPSFIDAARPEHAERLVRHFEKRLQEAGLHVETGRFGATMQVALVNSGPVTLLLEKSHGS